MIQYKLSATTEAQIKSFLKRNFNYNWDGSKTPQMLNETDCFVYLGQIPNQINIETSEVISWLDGLHFDILTDIEVKLTAGIIQHNPIEPKHKFC